MNKNPIIPESLPATTIDGQFFLPLEGFEGQPFLGLIRNVNSQMARVLQTIESGPVNGEELEDLLSGGALDDDAMAELTKMETLIWKIQARYNKLPIFED